jgi:hypothetical protein
MSVRPRDRADLSTNAESEQTLPAFARTPHLSALTEPGRPHRGRMMIVDALVNSNLLPLLESPGESLKISIPAWLREIALCFLAHL